MEEYLGTTELAEAAQERLGNVPELRRRGNTSERITDRTIRFYLKEGLIPAPLGKRGVSLSFGRMHLLSVLAIKRYQSLGLTNSQIRSLLSNKSEKQLEELLEEEVKTVTDPKEVDSYREMLQDDLDAELGTSVKRIELTATTNPAKEFFENRLFPAQRAESSYQAPLYARVADDVQAPASAPRQPATSDSWQRHELSDGIELHVRDDIANRLTETEGKEVRDKIERLLGLEVDEER